MKWPTPPKTPHLSTRTREFFAWFPIALGEITVWLEFVTVTEQYYGGGDWGTPRLVSSRSPWSC